MQVRGRSISKGKSRGKVSLRESPSCILVLGVVLSTNYRLVGMVVRLVVCAIFTLGKTEVLTENGDELTVCSVTPVSSVPILRTKVCCERAYLDTLFDPVMLMQNQVWAGKNLVKLVATTRFLGPQFCT